MDACPALRSGLRTSSSELSRLARREVHLFEKHAVLLQVGVRDCVGILTGAGRIFQIRGIATESAVGAHGQDAGRTSCAAVLGGTGVGAYQNR